MTIDEHDRGLAYDLSTLVHRRRLLQLFAGAGLVTVAGCASSRGGATAATSPTTAAATTTASSASTSSCVTAIPEETAGPYPGDGSNGVNVLDQSGIVRKDITSSFGSSATKATGVPLTINVKVVDTANGCAPLDKAAMYLWHCDSEGQYSLYSQGATGENYLRGVQASAEDGTLSFTSIFPACYDGRWPHIHFEIFPDISAATSSGSRLVTSQFALPTDACNTVYKTSGYEQSVSNLSRVSLDSDNVFGDGYGLQIPSVSGSVTNGIVLSHTVGV